ncbi:hypothetical protein ONG05_002406 [Vibrio parahaemolyticus]|nr:hypothetical protein [Vibrio parahaemolyticus]
MAYRSIHKDVKNVTSSCGSSISCNYLEHVRFDFECNFCAALHYVFVIFSPERTYTHAYSLRRSINVMLSFLCEYESKVPQSLQLTSLDKLTAEVFRQYHFYCKKVKAPKGCAQKLKGALESVANSTDDDLPLIILPRIPQDKGTPNEPLSESSYHVLSEALKSHIDKLYEKLEFRKRVHAATPYSIDEVLKLMDETDGPAWYWEPSDERAIKTLLDQGHPLSVPYQEYLEAARDKSHPPTNPVHAVYQRYEDPQFRYKDKCAGRRVYHVDSLYRYFPNAVDQAAIVIFLMLQTGWNKETVFGLDDENYLDIMTGALNTDIALIFSEKQKGQSKNLPYFNPKTFKSPTSKSDKYSSYSLIELAKKLSKPFQGLELTPLAKGEHNTLFSCIKQPTKWKNVVSHHGKIVPVGRYSTLSYKHMWFLGVKGFFEQYEVHDNGIRIETAKDITARLRPTWVRYVRDKKKKPLSIVAMEQGHSNIETTDIHYDSSGVANKKRRERLSHELELLVKRFRERKFKGLLSTRDKNKLDTLNLRFFTIPNHENPLWACSDPYKPDWPESERIPIGQKCSSIHKCLFCSQVCIFEDSLPYLLQREIDIQNEQEDSDELEIIQYILDQWGDEKALKRAARYLRRHPRMLPMDLKSLSILFEDDI